MKSRFTTLMGTLISQYGKWMIFIIYALAVFVTWQNRLKIYALIPMYHRNTNFFFENILLIVVAIALFVGLARFTYHLKTPLFWGNRFQRAFERIGLRNSLGEYPILISRRKDLQKQYGFVYLLNNQGLTIADFENKSAQLEAALNIKIYRTEYAKNSSKTLLYAIPREYDVPTTISLDNSAFVRGFCKVSNLLCVGKTGSGKSYALSVLLGIYAKYVPAVSITICDYKKSSFAQFEDTPNFYGYEDVPDGIRSFYQEFSERLAANDEERNRHIRILLIDEYGVLIAAQDKKVAEELKTKLANLLFMGRSLNMRVIIGVQRADSEHFKAGARDQFKAILALADLSKEQKQMLFSDYKDKMTEHCGLGEGYLLIDGQDIERVKVAEVKDFKALNDTIREAMCR